MFWTCPDCQGALEPGGESVTCRACGRAYPLVAELPDFRVDAPAWIDFDRDRDRALHIDRVAREAGLKEAILDVFRNSRKFDEKKSQYRMRQVLSGLDKVDAQIDGWLAPSVPLRQISSHARVTLALFASISSTIAVSTGFAH